MNELMNGVQVLSERTVNISGTLGLGIFVIILAIICLVVVIISYIEAEPSSSICIIGVIVFGFFGMDLICNNNPQHYTEYKVTINDNITYKEFTDKFNIISQEGRIYTVKLKESGE